MNWKEFRGAYIELRDTLTKFFTWLADVFSGNVDWKNPNFPI